jgi:hypothetical protein
MDLNMNDRLTTYELSRRYGDSALIVEMLNMSNQMLADAPNVPCNKVQVHEVLIRDSYPQAEVHGYNEGVGSAASQTRSVQEGLMKMSIYSAVDKDLADTAGNSARVRMDEASGFVMGIGVQQAQKFIYGNKAKNVNEINGLATRLSNLNDRHVIDFGGAAADSPTSIYICALGAKLFHLLYNPNFGNIGVKREDKGVQDWEFSAGKRRPAYVEFFSTEFGLAIEHPDSVFRIVNVPTVGLTADQRGDLIDLVLHVQKMLPPQAATSCMYGNLAVEELVEKAAREKQVVVFSEKDPWNNPVNLINGMRVRRMDVINSGEGEFVSSGAQPSLGL